MNEHSMESESGWGFYVQVDADGEEQHYFQKRQNRVCLSSSPSPSKVVTMSNTDLDDVIIIRVYFVSILCILWIYIVLHY